METDYRVHGEVPLLLRIGAKSAGLSALHDAHRVDASAFITACNPLSQVTATDLNAAQQRELADEIQRRSLVCIGGIGAQPPNQWAPEPSFLVLGLSLEAAKALGIRFKQNAIVWSGRDAVPQLVLLR